MIISLSKYNEYYDKLQSISSKYNLCGIHQENGIVTCRRGVLCCDGCQYITENGCTIKAVGCKIWFCPDVLVTPEYADYFLEAAPVLSNIYKDSIPLHIRDTL